jgi:hypothetical protein
MIVPGGFRTMNVLAEADAVLRGRVLSIQIKADK